jgi:hypothetical protein
MRERNCLFLRRPAKYHGRHEKTFESVLGPLRLGRAYYHCERCQSGFCPRDRTLGLGLFSLTPGVLRMTTSTETRVSFEESSGLLHELAGAEVSAKQVERAAEALGAEIAAQEQKQAGNSAKVAPIMYLGTDGTGVPMRTQEVIGRAGKQTDGSSKTREAKLVTVWTAESRDDEGKLMRDPGSVTYSAAIESAATRDTSSQLSDFAERVSLEANRRGFNEAPSSGARRWRCLDMEFSRRVIPPGDSDSRPVSCQGTHQRHRKTPLPRWHREEELDSKPL